MESKISPLDRRAVVALVGFLALCLIVGAIGGAVTTPQIDGWYADLEKPFFTPPDWIFGPVWTTLYVMMAVAAWRIWRRGDDRVGRESALRLFGLQLAFNLAWSFAFFGARSPGLGLVAIVVLLSLVLLTLDRFRRIDRTAGWLLAPYVAWTAFATFLNAAIFLLN